ncbi:hypothetical protein B0H11DRAFT_2242904 [Mycena galericulata]|nr:hypothetical protein B0H11DRAFT_2242904 [Mycena galericulata]
MQCQGSSRSSRSTASTGWCAWEAHPLSLCWAMLDVICHSGCSKQPARAAIGAALPAFASTQQYHDDHSHHLKSESGLDVNCVLPTEELSVPGHKAHLVLEGLDANFILGILDEIAYTAGEVVLVHRHASVPAIPGGTVTEARPVCAECYVIAGSVLSLTTAITVSTDVEKGSGKAGVYMQTRHN